MRRKQKILSAAVFMIIVFIVPLIFMFTKKQAFSQEENRNLAKAPKLSFSTLEDKSFMRDMDKFLSDHFPGRVDWVKSKKTIDRIVGKTIINGIYIADNMLIEKLPSPNYDEVDKSVEAINKFAENYKKTKVSFMLAPTSAGIYPDKLPSSAPQLNQKEFIMETLSKVSSNVNVIDIYDAMISQRDEYIYYRTDHHWTSLGAYYAYKYAANNLGYNPIALNSFNIEHVSNNFKGTFYNKCFCDNIKKDTIDIYSDSNKEITYSVEMNDGSSTKKADSIYFRDYLDVADKYCVFLGNNQAYMNIKTNANTKKKILVIKDSYANSFVPFLANHYSEIAVIDLRYVKTSIREYINPDDFGQTLFLYNASTFSEDTNVKMAGFTQ